ncbi:MAG: shikimate kinase [Opitutales bacterium]|nr:shikimate kinase [Opitutales bacterium]
MKSSRKESANGPNLYLIGFMGVGKSAVGRSVARQLGMRFLDSDAVIESNEGRSISQIFADEGEAAFRAKERAFIESGHPLQGVVVGCGGGLPVPPGMREQLLCKGIVVCLFANPDTIIERTLGNDKRPLLRAADPRERVRALLAEREPVYMSTGIGVCAEGRSLSEIVRNVVRVYRREASSRKQPAVPAQKTS